MPIIRNFAEARKALRPYSLVSNKGGYTLARMRALMEYLGSPQEQLKIVHVAGTSGKTSTCYYAAALLKACGAKVGLTVSPHVDEVNERVQIDLAPLPETEFCRSLSEFIDKVEASELHPSYFELLVAFAFWEFVRQKVDYAVIEVGLGGLLDGTNVVERSDKVCIITDIGLDHTDILGDTLAEIATQKAGIIQDQNEVFLYDQGEDVLRPVRERVAEKRANVHVVSPQESHAENLLPLFQQRNLYLAEQAVNFVLQRDGKKTLTPEKINQAARVRIPARMEQFRISNKIVVVDGSHNAQKIVTLAESMKAVFGDQPVAALVGFVKDKDERWQGAVDALAGITNRVIVTAYTADQDTPKTSMDPEIVAGYCRQKGFETTVEPSPQMGYEKLLQLPEPVLLIVGSFYLLNAIRPLILEDSLDV